MIESKENKRHLPFFRLMNIALILEFLLFAIGAVFSSFLSVNAGQ